MITKKLKITIFKFDVQFYRFYYFYEYKSDTNKDLSAYVTLTNKPNAPQHKNIYMGEDVCY